MIRFSVEGFKIGHAVTEKVTKAPLIFLWKTENLKIEQKMN